MNECVRTVRVRVEPLPTWLDRARFLALPESACEPFDTDHLRVWLEVTPREAALLCARLRGLGIDGRALEVRVEPPLGRALAREARLADARARRHTTPGFTRPKALATGEGRFSLTPEALALSLGMGARGRTVLDACCGSGGNAVGFARAGCKVTAVDFDAARLAEARHNAEVYGVADRIRFVQGDALEVVAGSQADILFIDPPWGEHYDKRRSTRTDLPLLDALLALPLASYEEVWIKVPMSFEVASVPGASASAWFGEAPGDTHRIKFVLLRRGR